MGYTAGLNVAQCNIRGTVDLQEIENVLFFKSNTTVTFDSLQQLANDLRDFWFANALPTLPTTYRFNEVYAVDRTTQTSETATAVTAVDADGTLTGATLPNNVSFTITFNTANRGRSYRGRNYWPLLREVDVTNNSLDESRAGAIRGVYELMIGPDEVSSNWTWGVFSQIQNGVQLANGVFTPIQTVKYTDLIVDSQRRRLPKRGR